MVAQSFLETLVGVKPEALKVEKKKAPAKKMTHAMTWVKNDTPSYLLREVETDLWVVTEVDMLKELKVQALWPR